MDVCRIERGDSPVIVSFPHSGTFVPRDLRARFTEAAGQLPDTDWHVPELYDFISTGSVTTIVANVSRYVVDLNRSPDDVELYPGRPSTGVFPTTTFSGDSIYRAGCEPDAGETRARVSDYWDPYHDALAQLVHANILEFGLAVIYDAHSIAPVIPRLFEGELPVLNLGTANGRACGEEFERPVREVVTDSGFTHAINGRFIGGHITRHYGRPERCCHVMQMEISQRAYLDAREPALDSTLAKPLRETLRTVLRALTEAVNRSVTTGVSS